MTPAALEAPQIRLYGDPLLRQVCEPVERFDSTLDDAVALMVAALDADPNALAVAAPQVGLLVRAFVMRVAGRPGATTIINPVLSHASGRWRYNEGCLSMPGVFFSIERPKSVSINHRIVRGPGESLWHADGIDARVVQHEKDHLDGRLMIDRLPVAERKAAMARLGASRA